MLARARRAIRLGYLVGRAVIHTFVSPTSVSTYCQECGSLMENDGHGGVVIRHGLPGVECPVHVAWRELLRGGQ